MGRGGALTDTPPRVTAVYAPPGRFRRTEQERADEALSWARPDQAFFAAGACHILAWAFLRRHPTAGFRVVALRAEQDAHASHVYVAKGGWAFDHAGWTREDELVAAITETEARNYERLHVDGDLASFCADHNSRQPHQYVELPWRRAEDYIVRLGGDEFPVR